MKFRNLEAQYLALKKDIDKAISRVLSKGVFIGGEEVDRLEMSLADYVGVKHCITCANGTDALTLVLMAWDIGKGDAVFVPDFTFFATAEAVSLRGATPIFVDVRWDTFNIDFAKLEMAIEDVLKEGKLIPKAIIPVDLFGQPAEYDKIEKIATKCNLQVLEDGAQGFGGRIGDRMACSFGNASTTSFFPAKPLGCYGDGGAVFTNDDDLAEYIRSIKVHGKGRCKYDNIRIGVNSRLDTIQAAILNVKLEAFRAYELQDTQSIAQEYDRELKAWVETPKILEGYESSYAQYTIKLRPSENREGIIEKLRNEGIPSMVYYLKPLHRQGAFKDVKKYSSLLVSESLSHRVLSLPIDPRMSIEDTKFIIKKLAECLEIMTDSPRRFYET